MRTALNSDKIKNKTFYDLVNKKEIIINNNIITNPEDYLQYLLLNKKTSLFNKYNESKSVNLDIMVMLNVKRLLLFVWEHQCHFIIDGIKILFLLVNQLRLH